MRDEQNKNRQTEEDRIIDAYLNQIDAEAPDLWDRIEAGLDSEAKDAEENNKIKDLDRIKQTTNITDRSNKDQKYTGKKSPKMKYVIPVLAIAAVLLAAVIAAPLLSDSKRHLKEINTGRTTGDSNDGLDAAESPNASDQVEADREEAADSIPETVQNETATRPTQNETADMDEWQEMSNIAVTLQITEIVIAETEAVQKYAAKLLQVSDTSGKLITGQNIILQPEETETFAVGEEVTGTLLRYDSERQAWILSRQ